MIRVALAALALLAGVSAVDAFQTLEADGLLEKVALPKETLAR